MVGFCNIETIYPLADKLFWFIQRSIHLSIATSTAITLKPRCDPGQQRYSGYATQATNDHAGHPKYTYNTIKDITNPVFSQRTTCSEPYGWVMQILPYTCVPVGCWYITSKMPLIHNRTVQ